MWAGDMRLRPPSEWRKPGFSALLVLALLCAQASAFTRSGNCRAATVRQPTPGHGTVLLPPPLSVAEPLSPRGSMREL